MTYLRMFKALLWKEFREALPMLIIGLLLSGAVSVFFFTEFFSRVDESGYIGKADLFVQTYVILLTAALGFILFLPLISRESEKKVFSMMQVKPISPEVYGIFQWLTAYLYSLLLVMILLFSIILITYVYSGGYYLSMNMVSAGGSLALFSLAHYLISTLTNNRFRSFGLGIFAFVIVFLVTASAQEGIIIGSSYLTTFYYVNQPLFLTCLALLLALLTLWILRIRMTWRLFYWQYYTGGLAVILVLFVIFMALNISNRNVTRSPITAADAEGLTPMVFNAIRSSEEGRYRFRHGFGWELINNKYLYRFEPRSTGFSYNFSYHGFNNWKSSVPESPETFNFVLGEIDRNQQFKTVINQPIQELFNASSLQNNELYNRYYVWNNASAWKYQQMTPKYGILQGTNFWTNLVQEYIKRYGGSLEDFEVIWEMPDYVDDPATYQYPTDLNERYAEFRKFAREFAGREINVDDKLDPTVRLDAFLLGKVILDGTPAVEPVKEIELHYFTPEGRKTATVQAREPGVFFPEDLDHLFVGMPWYNRNAPEADPHVLYLLEEPPQWGKEDFQPKLKKVVVDDLEKVSLIWGSMYTLRNTRNFLLLSHYGNSQDYATDDVVFNTDVVGITGYLLFSAYDFSELGKLKYYVGGEFFTPLINRRDIRSYSYWWWYRNFNYAVENDRLLIAYREQNQEVLSILDVSNLENMHEVKRYYPPLSLRLTNWNILEDSAFMNKVHFVSDKLMVHNDKEVTIYQIGADHSIKPFARLINPLNLISNVVLRDDSILVNEIPFARRYAFGETAEVPPAPEEDLWLAETDVYKRLFSTLNTLSKADQAEEQIQE